MNSITEKININHTEMNYRKLLEQIKFWVDSSMVINKDRITVITELPKPMDVQIPPIEELKDNNYTGLEYLVLTCIALGEEIGANKILEAGSNL